MAKCWCKQEPYTICGDCGSGSWSVKKSDIAVIQKALRELVNTSIHHNDVTLNAARRLITASMRAQDLIGEAGDEWKPKPQRSKRSETQSASTGASA